MARAVVQNAVIAHNHRPFSGGRGYALYAASFPVASDPGSAGLVYRNDCALIPSAVWAKGGRMSGGTRTTAVQTVKDPTKTFTYDYSGHADKVVYLQVRPHDSDIETPIISGVRRIELDSSNDVETKLYGTGKATQLQKRDGGTYRFYFTWTQDTVDGVDPVDFLLVKTVGPGSIGTITTSYSAALRNYKLEVTGLTDATAYTFEIHARNGSNVKKVTNLNNTGTSISFTADNAGPSQPGAITVTEL